MSESGWSERDLATIRAADEIITARDRGDCTPGLAADIGAGPRSIRRRAFGSGLAVSPRTAIEPTAASELLCGPDRLPGPVARDAGRHSRDIQRNGSSATERKSREESSSPRKSSSPRLT
jgi:hypothetical protein